MIIMEKLMRKTIRWWDAFWVLIEDMCFVCQKQRAFENCNIVEVFSLNPDHNVALSWDKVMFVKSRKIRRVAISSLEKSHFLHCCISPTYHLAETDIPFYCPICSIHMTKNHHIRTNRCSHILPKVFRDFDVPYCTSMSHDGMMSSPLLVNYDNITCHSWQTHTII